MATKKDHPVRNTVVGGLITTGVLALVNWLVPGGWGSVFSKTKILFAALFSWLVSATPIPVWLIIVLSLSAAALLMFALITVIGFCRSNTNDERLAFRDAVFSDVKWRWEFGHNGIQNLAAFCPKCDLQVHPFNPSGYRAVDFTAFRCDEGHWESQVFDCSYVDLEDRVRRKIQQELRKRHDATAGKSA